MIAPVNCDHAQRSKHGKDRKGNQRWKCHGCGCTITAADHRRPLGDMRIELADAVRVLELLLEGVSIRATERITGIKRDTICDLVLLVGGNCDEFLRRTVKNQTPKAIQLDEQWSFVGCKAKTAQRLNRGPEVGDSWTWYAIDADSKLILSHTTGNRDEDTAKSFLMQLADATVGRSQVTADGLTLYTYAVPLYMGSRVDFAQLIKTYASNNTDTRYSPAVITGIQKMTRFGTPDEALISTSYSERFNLSVRMQNRRCTRLTNGHSKSRPHHAAMHALYVAFYNFARAHMTLKVKGGPKRTPAMAAGLAGHVWTIEELLVKAA